MELRLPDPVILDTPAGRHVEPFIDAVNSADEQTVRRCISDHYAKSALEQAGLEPRVGVVERLLQRTGGLTLSWTMNVEGTGRPTLPKKED
jgi:hypothetical protein